MDSRTLYDEDIYAWSEQQAAVLRRLGETPLRLPNELDIEHVAEEIEDLGKSEKHAAESALRLILVHLIKLSAAPTAPAVRHWRREIISFHIELLSRLTPAMRGRIDLDRLWTLAKREARAGLDEDELREVTIRLWDVDRCPIALAMLARDDFEADEALALLRSLG